jgi:hypothetical protein
MKKTIYLLCLLGIILGSKHLNAQLPSILVSPQSQCYNVIGNTSNASVSFPIPGAVSYNWSVASPSNCVGSVTSFSNGFAATISYSCCGVYTITCMAIGSNSTVIGTIVQTSTVRCLPNVSITVSPSETICAGSTAVLMASGLNSYTWSSGSFSPSISVNPTTTTCYVVGGYDATTGCSVSATKCIYVNSSSTPSISGTFNICNGATAILQASGANSYTWLPGGITSPTIAVSPTITSCYTLIGSSCSGTNSAVRCVTVGTSPVISVSGNTTICSGNTTTLTASGANTYTWTTSMGTFFGSSIVFSPTTTTCYSVSANSILGCGTGYTGGCITVLPSSSISISGNSTICNGAYTSLYASGASNYTWQPGGTTDNSITINPNSSTCYTVFGVGCSGIVSAVKCVSVSSTSAPNLNVSGNLNICSGFGTTLTATGANSYTWMIGTGTYTGSVIALTPSATTCFTLVGSNGSGCTDGLINCITVSPLNNISINGNASTCSGAQTILYASGSLNYTWQPGGSNSPTIAVSPTATSCYTLSGTGCSGIVSAIKCVTVSPLAAPTISISGNQVICAGTGATLTASGANSYTWITSQGTFTGSTVFLTPSATSCFSVIGSNGSACLGSTYACITVIPSNSISISGNANTCSGGYTSLFASGGTNYTWMPGGSNNSSITISPTVTTCYTLSGIGCSGVISAVKCITVNPTPVISIYGNTTICSGNSTNLTASGASTYTWNTSMGIFTGSTIVLSPTTTTCYSIAATNAQGCNAYSGGCITVVGGNISTTGNTGICSGSNATLTASGAQSYTWLPINQVGSSIVVSPTTTTCYTVLGYSQPGCAGSGLACVSILSGGSPTISGNFSTCNGATTILQALGSNSYTWLPSNSNSPTIAVSPTTTTCYTLVGSSCTGINSAVRCVTVGASPAISVSGNTSVCAGGSTTLTASGAYSYTWNTSMGTFFGSSIVLSPTATTCYSVSGGNLQGCGYGYTSGCITVVPVSTISIIGNTSVCAGGNTNLFAYGASSYTWLPGNLTGSIVAVTPSTSVCYTVVGTQPTGCVSLGYHCVQSIPKPTITTSNGIFCTGAPAVLQAQGASTYTWIPFGLTGSSISITPSTSACYTVFGMNGSGCTNSVSSCFSVIPSPVITVTGNSTICAGASSTLSASGAGSFTWLPLNISSSSIVVSPSVSTIYTVVGTNGNCSSSVTRLVHVQAQAPLTISGNNVICAGTSANLLASGANTYTWNTGSNSQVVTVTPTVSTCYTVTGTNAFGCIGSAVKCISVQTAPSITISGPGSVCAGSNALLIASGASSYIWNTGSTSSVIVVAPTISTVYTVTGNNGICSATKSVSVLVTPKPSISILRTDSVSNDSIICSGDVAHLYAIGANSYTWNNGPVSQFFTVNPNTTTTYTVSGTNLFGCSNSNTITLYVSACTGLSKNSTSTQIEMYPNPSSGQFILKGDGLNKINYRVFDLLGKEILKGELGGSKNIDLSSYANGTYIIRFEAGSVMTYKKLIIEKQ